MKGITATIAAGGANSASLARRFMNDAINEEERWFVGFRNVSSNLKSRERCLLCSKSWSRIEYSFVKKDG